LKKQDEEEGRQNFARVKKHGRVLETTNVACIQ